MQYKKIKPLFKYIGGKSWLRETLRSSLLCIIEKQKIDTYVEPFCGGLGAFLGVYDILHQKNVRKIHLNDINKNLIDLYKQIQKSPDELVNEFENIENKFIKTIPIGFEQLKNKSEIKQALIQAEIFFKEVRKEFNINKNLLSNPQQAARLIFLQKHAFNGIYRENAKGEYNTPFNWGSSQNNTTIQERIRDLNDLFTLFEIDFTNQSFEELIYQKTNVYYLDPPYLNEETAENKYNKQAFGLSHQLKLIDCIKNSLFIYSNHDSEQLKQEFEKIKKISIQYIQRKNVITSDASTRATKVSEILVIKDKI